jgi:tryptophan synthase alpha chain
VSRYQAMFARLSEQGAGAFVPFCVLGDPTPDASFGVIEALVRGGADALELGIPFSDPVADGPTIQAADVRALDAGTRPADAWRIIARVRAAHPDIPIGLLVYANLVESPGRGAFYRAAAEAGVDSVLVADVPTLEVRPFAKAAEEAGIEPVLIATATASGAALDVIAATTRGYTYVVSRRGVTGAEEHADTDQGALLERLRARNAAPALLGFGISTPDHVKTTLAAGAAGAISGSAVVRIVERHLDDAVERAAALEKFTRQMKTATLA